MDAARIVHSISVDVEEYYHATNLEHVAPPRDWHRLPSRVVRSTDRCLELFSRYKVKGTFFILGCVARRHPDLVRRIASEGHEIASHGYSHRLAFSQTPKQFLRDVRRARALLEDLSGSNVLGYRAPSFSIRDDNDWGYDALLEAGYRYDSSLFPIWHPRYSNLSRSPRIHHIARRSGTLTELPLAVHSMRLLSRELRLPAAGGAYWRLLPTAYCLGVLRAIERTRREPFHCYFHPWELDTGQPVFRKLSPLTRLRHYGGTARFESRLETFFGSFAFGPIRDLAVVSEGAQV